MKYCMKRLSTRTVLGKSQENIFRLIMDIVYKEKNIDESKMSDQEYDDFIKSAAPKVYDEIKSDIEAFDQKLQQFAKDNGIKKENSQREIYRMKATQSRCESCWKEKSQYPIQSERKGWGSKMLAHGL